MGWLIGIGISCFVIWLMVVSRGFRYLVLFIGAGIGIWIYSNIEEGKKKEVQRELSSVGFNVTIQDCPSECVTIGESGAIARVSVPPGQARTFTASATFYALPQASVPQWHYTIKTIYGVPRD